MEYLELLDNKTDKCEINVLTGENGVGKSSILVDLYRQCLDTNKNCIIINGKKSLLGISSGQSSLTKAMLSSFTFSEDGFNISKKYKNDCLAVSTSRDFNVFTTKVFNHLIFRLALSNYNNHVSSFVLNNLSYLGYKNISNLKLGSSITIMLSIDLPAYANFSAISPLERYMSQLDFITSFNEIIKVITNARLNTSDLNLKDRVSQFASNVTFLVNRISEIVANELSSSEDEQSEAFFIMYKIVDYKLELLLVLPDVYLRLPADGEIRSFVQLLYNLKKLKRVFRLAVDQRYCSEASIKLSREFMFQDNDQLLGLDDLSSGQYVILSNAVLLIMLNLIGNGNGRSNVLLIDEPENSLHPRWQLEYINVVLNSFTENLNCIVIATHSPLIYYSLFKIPDDNFTEVNQKNFFSYLYQVNKWKSINKIYDIKLFGVESSYLYALGLLVPDNYFVPRRLNVLLDRALESGRNFNELDDFMRLIRSHLEDQPSSKLLKLLDNFNIVVQLYKNENI